MREDMFKVIVERPRAYTKARRAERYGRGLAEAEPGNAGVAAVAAGSGRRSGGGESAPPPERAAQASPASMALNAGVSRKAAKSESLRIMSMIEGSRSRASARWRQASSTRPSLAQAWPTL